MVDDLVENQVIRQAKSKALTHSYQATGVIMILCSQSL
jgi:hypothetical protein